MSQPEESEERGFIGRVAAGASDLVLDIVDPNLVLEHVDINAILDRVDINAILGRVDVDILLERIDVDALMERVDIDALMERVDIPKLVDRAGIPEIVAESTSHLGGSALDLFRRPLVGLDEIFFRVLNRLVGRNPSEFPTGPGDLVERVDQQNDESKPIKTGRYAGPLTRLLAVILDGFVVTATFALIMSGVVFLIDLFIPSLSLPVNQGLWYGITLVLWSFTYLWFGLSVFGKTLGKWVLGVRVVGADGNVTLRGRQAFLRAVTYPVSFAFLGLGLLGAVFGRERRTWHDHFAGSAVVYDWGSRTAAMPTPLARFLERRSEEEE